MDGCTEIGIHFTTVLSAFAYFAPRGGRGAVHMLGYWVCSPFLLPQDLYFTVRDDGASEKAAKLP